MSTTRRAYRSPRREQDAATTRNDVLAAAAELFAAKGYGRVTVADISQRAGVAQKTVYASAGSKADILNELIAAAVADSGAEESLVEIRKTGDLAEAMRILARGTRLCNERHEAALEIMHAALPVHDDAESLWRNATEFYRSVLGRIAEHLDACGVLAEPQRAADVLWFCFGLTSWRTLVRECGWTWDDAERWLAVHATALLSRRPDNVGPLA